MKANSFANLAIVLGEVHVCIGMTKPRIELDKLGAGAALNISRFDGVIDGLDTVVPFLCGHINPNVKLRGCALLRSPA